MKYILVLLALMISACNEGKKKETVFLCVTPMGLQSFATSKEKGTEAHREGDLVFFSDEAGTLVASMANCFEIGHYE